jgi:hypothetical protein
MRYNSYVYNSTLSMGSISSINSCIVLSHSVRLKRLDLNDIMCINTRILDSVDDGGKYFLFPTTFIHVLINHTFFHIFVQVIDVKR